MLLDFSLPIEEVCGGVRTYLGVSGCARRITTAGRDGKTHKGCNRKHHVVLLLHFSGGIKGCGDILVLTVRQGSHTARLALSGLIRLSSGVVYLLEVGETFFTQRCGLLFFFKITHCCVRAHFSV